MSLPSRRSPKSRPAVTRSTSLGDRGYFSNAKQGGYGKFSAQYAKLEEAYRLAPEAALRSASWGRFQIMGANFKAAGFTSVEAFVLAMSRAESEHLKAFTHFVMSNKAMLSALREHDWARLRKPTTGQAI